MYVFLFVFAIVLGVFLMWLILSDRVSMSTDIGSALLPVAIVILTYGVSCAVTLLTKKDLEYDMTKYLKAKTEIEIFSNDCSTIPLKVASEYYNDITDANNLVMKSRKYHDNWYLKQFYYKEIADLPLLKCDSAEVKISI